jgi:transposase
MSKRAKVQRLDHLGVIGGVIRDLGLIEKIDARISPDSRESITTGEAVAGMIINGLGFSDRPMTLTPQFFENKPMKKLFREHAENKHFNRFKLGRALDDCHEYGCDALFAELSLQICKEEKVDTRFNALDTTAFALTGEYDEDSDEHTIEIRHGYSKDHRPDLKQAVLEMMCTHDGGIPLLSKSWNGNSSDTKIFRQRARNLMKSFKEGASPRYLVADAKLYDKQTIENYLKDVPFITRVPGSIKLEKTTICEVLKKEEKEWTKLDEKYRFIQLNKKHYEVEQRWIVVSSKEAKSRAEKRVEKKIVKEKKELERFLSALERKTFSCSKDALRALKDYEKKVVFHEIIANSLEENKKYEGKGRPKENAPYEKLYRIKGATKEKIEKRKTAIEESSCFIITTTVPEKELNNAEVIQAYKSQNDSVEKGFRFLKDPIMFTSSLFIKKPSRIMGLLMVMTLALLVYSIAQRRLHQALQKAKKTLPNQINKEVKKPSLRWIFQLLEGIDVINLTTGNHIEQMISGLTDLKKIILSYFGDTVKKIYELEIQPAPSF